MEKTQSIKELVDAIDNKKIFLPEFQRDFVWEVSKNYDLFDSLIKNIFIGPIIFGIPSFDIAIKEIDNRPRITKGKRRTPLVIRTITKEEIEQSNKAQLGFRLILDGQQRTTSIYRALKGTDSVYFVSNGQVENFENAQLDELLLEISGTEDAENLSIKLSDVWEIEMNDYDTDEIKSKFFESTKYFSTIKDDQFVDKNLEWKKFKVLRKKISDFLKSEKLLNFYLLDMSLDKFIVFFERSNTKGVQLNFIDILAAKLYTGNFNLKNKIQTFESVNENYTLVPEIIVRTLAYIKSSPKDINRNYILSNLNASDFNTNWDSLCSCYIKVLDFLFENHYIISQDWMPYENMVIPLIIFLREIKGQDFHQMTANQKEFIEYWYWNSIFSARYSGASNERIVEDSDVMFEIAHNKKLHSFSYFNKLNKTQILSPDDIRSFNRKINAIYKGILNIINFHVGGFLNWSNDSKLSLNSNIEDHHIFPQKYLQEILNEEDFDLIDCVANRTLIPKIQNISIGRKSPSDYLSEIKEKYNDNISKSLENHLIPDSLINGEYDSEFSFFVQYRCEEIFKIIDKHVISIQNGVRSAFFQPMVYDELTNISIFSVYKKIKVEATFNPSTLKLFYKGEVFETPSAGAVKVKLDCGAQDNTTENGWTFWRYIDSNGIEQKLNKLKQDNSPIN